MNPAITDQFKGNYPVTTGRTRYAPLRTIAKSAEKGALCPTVPFSGSDLAVTDAAESLPQTSSRRRRSSSPTTMQERHDLDRTEQSASLATAMSTLVPPSICRVDAEKPHDGSPVFTFTSNRPPQMSYWQLYYRNANHDGSIIYKITLHSGWTPRHTSGRGAAVPRKVRVPPATPRVDEGGHRAPEVAV